MLESGSARVPDRVVALLVPQRNSSSLVQEGCPPTGMWVSGPMSGCSSAGHSGNAGFLVMLASRLPVPAKGLKRKADWAGDGSPWVAMVA